MIVEKLRKFGLCYLFVLASLVGAVETRNNIAFGQLKTMLVDTIFIAESLKRNKVADVLFIDRLSKNIVDKLYEVYPDLETRAEIKTQCSVVEEQRNCWTCVMQSFSFEIGRDYRQEALDRYIATRVYATSCVVGSKKNIKK